MRRTAVKDEQGVGAAEVDEMAASRVGGGVVEVAGGGPGGVGREVKEVRDGGVEGAVIGGVGGVVGGKASVEVTTKEDVSKLGGEGDVVVKGGPAVVEGGVAREVGVAGDVADGEEDGARAGGEAELEPEDVAMQGVTPNGCILGEGGVNVGTDPTTGRIRARKGARGVEEAIGGEELGGGVARASMGFTAGDDVGVEGVKVVDAGLAEGVLLGVGADVYIPCREAELRQV